MAQVALAWILSKDGMSFHFAEETELSLCIPVVAAPIVGTNSLEKLHDTISMFFSLSSPRHFFAHVIITESVHVKLTDEEIRYLEEPYKPKGVIGHK